MKKSMKYEVKFTPVKLDKITVEFKSRTQPGIVYKTERHRDGKVTCFCPGFVYSGKCWHSERMKQYKNW